MARVERVNKVIAAIKRQTVKRPRGSVIVGFTQNYALAVHEIQRNFTEGKSKYLTDPLKRLQRELGRIVSTAMRRGVEMMQAILLAGLRLQREAQDETPVDTGALRASAFTGIEGVDAEANGRAAFERSEQMRRK